MGIARRSIPAVVGMVASETKTLYAGAFGRRDASGVPVRVDSIFQIASMTKAITTVAALQLVEQGKVDLDEAGRQTCFRNSQTSKYWKASMRPESRRFDPPGRRSHCAIYSPTPPAFVMTPGMAICSDTCRRMPANATGKPGPLMFEPGTRWQYGQGVDWAGRLVEAIQRRYAGELLPRADLPATWNAGHELHPAGPEVRTHGERLSPRWQTASYEQNKRKLPAAPTDVQWRRRPVLHRGRLRAIHADDPQPRHGTKQNA